MNPEDLEYQPAPGSPSLDAGKGNASSDSEDDPLDAFMAGIEVTYLGKAEFTARANN